MSRFYAFSNMLCVVVANVKSVAYRIRLLLWIHAAYMVHSGDRQLVSEDDGGTKCDTWLSGSVVAMRLLMASAARYSRQRQDGGGDSIALKRHGISGLPFSTNPVQDDEDTAGDAGGSGLLQEKKISSPSLVGVDDPSHKEPSLSGDEDSLLHTLWEHRAQMSQAMDHGETMPESTPVMQLLKFLKKSCIKGGGGLISERAITYAEVTGAMGDVLTPYLKGGQGSAKAKTFAGAVLDLDDEQIKKVSTLALLTELKRMLEETNGQGDRRIGAALRQTASNCPALAPLQAFAATIGNTLLTGGSLETMLCDVVWRCFRRDTLGCEKPRLIDWNESTSGGNPLTVFPIFQDGSSLPKYFHIAEYLEAYIQEGAAPPVATYIRDN